MNCIIKPAGDCAVTIELGNSISPEVNHAIRALQKALAQCGQTGIIEVQPAYCSMTLHYDPAVLPYRTLCGIVDSAAKNASVIELPAGRVIELPVLYGGEEGPDLDEVAKYNHISSQEVIRLHTEGYYLVYMLGFVPGFPYLGGMNEKIATPRLETPRTIIPSGSVGIAGKQTGVYPLSTPGGWRLIGRTPVRLYAPERKEPILLRAGDTVRFRPVSCEEYQEIRMLDARGEYCCEVEKETL